MLRKLTGFSIKNPSRVLGNRLEINGVECRLALLSTPMDKTRLFDDGFADKYVAALFWLGILLWLGSLIMLSAQIVLFLKDGTWPTWALIDVLYPVLPIRFLRWLTAPHNWFGLHEVVKTILFQTPTFVGTSILGLICIYGPIKVGKV